MLDCDNLEEEFVVGVLDSGVVKTTTTSFLLPSFDMRNLYCRDPKTITETKISLHFNFIVLET